MLRLVSIFVSAAVVSITASTTNAGVHSNHRVACPMPITEKSFNSIIHAMFLENLIPEGDILDCGANDGEWSCMYACFDPKRTVRALDPFKENYDKISCPHYPNVVKYPIGISKSPGYFVDGNKRGYQFNLDSMSQIKKEISEENKALALKFDTIDSFFNSTAKSIPGFLHLDLEGYELAALQGGRDTIVNHSPVIAFEAHLTMDKELVKQIFIFLEELQYKTFMVNEVCGLIRSCRNFIAVPKILTHTLVRSPIFEVALRSWEMVSVSESTVFSEYQRLESSRPAHSWRQPSAINL